MKYEQLPKEDHLVIRNRYQEEGLKIPLFSQVLPTDWAIQNGVKKHHDRAKYFKTSNKGISVYVLKDGSHTPRPYWAGFWKLKQ